eukprot:TRINITY_DN9407_c0_g3_i4.p1 TRINITY_DN9407_c0_g3~~TRINITY_DN9407_c0_g3_i4.p1  ORF type:complete len:602 (-),score=219.66 TRINITY_DN9407_c0_g3_i4:896-2701(-)
MVNINVHRFLYGDAIFYKMQLLQDRITKIYILWTRWGRLGSSGEYQRTPFNNLEEAEKEFKKVFLQKTGNKWDDISNYEEKLKKFKLRELDGKAIVKLKDKVEFKSSSIDTQMLLEPFKLKKSPSSNLPQELQDLLRLVADEKMAQAYLKKIYSAVSTVTLTEIDSSTVKKASKILNDISTELIELQKAKQERDMEKTTRAYTKLYEMSDRYYELLSPTSYAYTAIKPITDQQQLDFQRKALTDIYDVEVALKLIGGAKLRIKEVHPYDYFVKAIQVKINQLDEKGKEYFFVKQCMERTRGVVSEGDSMEDKFISSIFKIAPRTSLPAEEEELFKKTHNHAFLWHGTSVANLLGILSQGLRISPFSANLTGNIFGNAIYFSDSLMKALDYARSGCKLSVILLCEVALGNIYSKLGSFDPEENALPKNFHSLKIVAQRGPSVFGKSEENVLYPVGDMEEYAAPYYEEKGVKYTDYWKYEERKEKKYGVGVALGGRAKKLKQDEEENKEESDKSEKEDNEEFMQKVVTKDDFMKPRFRSYRIAKSELSAFTAEDAREGAEYLVFNPAQARVRYVVVLEDEASGSESDDEEQSENSSEEDMSEN